MCTPTQKGRKARQRSRRSHMNAGKLMLRLDADGLPHLPHQINPTTGTYRGRKIVDVEKRSARHARKVKALS